MWKRDEEGGTCARAIGFRPGPTVHRFRKGTNDGETDAGPTERSGERGIDAIEALGDLRPLRCRQARAEVLDGQDDGSGVTFGSDHHPG